MAKPPTGDTIHIHQISPGNLCGQDYADWYEEASQPGGEIEKKKKELCQTSTSCSYSFECSYDLTIIDHADPDPDGHYEGLHEEYTYHYDDCPGGMSGYGGGTSRTIHVDTEGKVTAYEEYREKNITLKLVKGYSPPDVTGVVLCVTHERFSCCYTQWPCEETYDEESKITLKWGDEYKVSTPGLPSCQDERLCGVDEDHPSMCSATADHYVTFKLLACTYD